MDDTTVVSLPSAGSLTRLCVCLQTTTPICAAPSILLHFPEQELDEGQQERVSLILQVFDDATLCPLAALI